MYQGHPKSNHKLYGHVCMQINKKNEGGKQTVLKGSNIDSNLMILKMSVSDKIIVCLGRLLNLMKKFKTIFLQ